MIRLKSYLSLNQYHEHTKFDSDSFPIVLDTEASCVMSIDINDIIKLDRYKDDVSGLGAIRVEGKGNIQWPILNDNNEQVELVIKGALYAPNLPIQYANPLLILSQQLVHKNTRYEGNTENVTMHLNDFNISKLYDTNTNLPIYYSAPDGKHHHSYLSQPTIENNNNKQFAYTATLSNLQR